MPIAEALQSNAVAPVASGNLKRTPTGPKGKRWQPSDQANALWNKWTEELLKEGNRDEDTIQKAFINRKNSREEGVSLYTLYITMVCFTRIPIVSSQPYSDVITHQEFV